MSENNQIYEVIRANLRKLQQSKQEHTHRTDCDWIFNNVKDDIIQAVKNNVSLTDIAKSIATASRYTNNDNKLLKVTGAKLAVWLKANGIARKIHKRKAKKNVKKDDKNVN